MDEISSKKVMRGFGYGCGLLLIILILLIAGGYFYISNKIAALDELEKYNDSLSANFDYSFASSYPADYSIPPDRILLFINIRDSLKASMGELIESIQHVETDLKEFQKDDGVINIFHLAKSGFSLIPELSDFYRVRTRLLKINGMDLSEYYFIYIAAFYIHKHYPIWDGPDFQLVADDNSLILTDRQEDTGGDPERIKTVRSKRIRNIVRDIFLKKIRSDLKKIQFSSYGSEELLIKESERLENFPDSMPWENSAPGFITRSIIPFQFELARTYSPILNPLELNPYKF